MRRGQAVLASVFLAMLILLPLAGMTLASTPQTEATGLDRPVQCVYVDGDAAYAGAYLGEGVYVSTNNGVNWGGYGSGLAPKDVLAILRRGDYLLVGTWSDGGVYRRSAIDTSWSSFKEGMVEDYRWIRAMTTGTGSSPVTYTYAADPELIYQLPGDSSTWQEMPSTDLPSDYYVGELFVDDDGHLYAGLRDAGVYEYTGTYPGDTSGVWRKKGVLLGNRSVLAIAYGPDGALWAGAYKRNDTNDPGGLFRWNGTFGSGSWEAVSETAGWDVTAMKRNPVYTDELFVGLHSGRVYRNVKATADWNWSLVDLGILLDQGMRVWSLDCGTGPPQHLLAGVSKTDVSDGGLYYADVTHPNPNLTLDNDPGKDAALSDGDLITYTVGFENVGTHVMHGVVITSHIPADNVTFVDASGVGTEVEHGGKDYVRWSVGDVAAEHTTEVTYTVRVDLEEGGLGGRYGRGTWPVGVKAMAKPILSPAKYPTIPPQELLCDSPDVEIPDDSADGITSTISVDEAGIIADLNVYLRISHPHVGDLIVSLTHEDTGQTVTLIDRPGVPDTDEGCTDDDIHATLDDEATDPVEDECGPGTPAIEGNLIPEESLGSFDGESLSGTWTLNVSDGRNTNEGTLIMWCLVAEELAPPVLIINEGAYATWQGGPEDGVTTGPVYNWIGTPHRIYLPLVMKNPG